MPKSGVTTWVLWNNPCVYCEYLLLSLVNKEADWPRGRQIKFRQYNQTKDIGTKKDRVRE